MKKRTFHWELFCAIGTIILGFLFHFAFSWFGSWKPSALFFAVNESVWEHCKIAFWPALLFAVIEYLFIGKSLNNFIISKFTLLFTITLTIIVLFYSYTGILGYNLLILDIMIFFIAIIFGQYLSYKLLIHKQLNKLLNILSCLFIIVLIIAFSTFTFYPPHINLFKDPQTKTYGIPDKSS